MMASIQVLNDKTVKSKNPQGAITEDDQSYVLTSVLDCMRNHLDFEEIGMWMVQEKVVTMTEYEENIHDILIATQNGQMQRSQAVPLIARIVQKKGTFNQFMSALRKSSVKVPAHNLIIKEIEDQLKIGDEVTKDDTNPSRQGGQPLVS